MATESTIVVNELTVKVVRKKIKNLHLAVYPPDGWVRIAVPERIDDEAVRLAIVSKLAWIKRQIMVFENQERQSARELVVGESHYFLGNRYLLDIVHTEGRPFVEIKNKKKLVLHVNEGSGWAQREKLLNDWYRREMYKMLPRIVDKWEQKTTLRPAFVGIKRMKTKWGSCHPQKKRVWLNLELIKKPPQCLEYVFVHEITHFLERHHNANFVEKMDGFMPHWRSCRDELNSAPLAHENWRY